MPEETLPPEMALDSPALGKLKSPREQVSWVGANLALTSPPANPGVPEETLPPTMALDSPALGPPAHSVRHPHDDPNAPPHPLPVSCFVKETVQVVPQEKVVYVDRPVFVDRYVERVVQVPVHVPYRVDVPVPVHLPVPVHVPMPIQVPLLVPGPQAPPTIQHLHLSMIAGPGGPPEGCARPDVATDLPPPEPPLMLEAPPVLLLGPPPIQEMSSDDEEDAPAQSQKKRKFERLSDWPPDWKEKYEALKAAFKLSDGEGHAKALWDTWDRDLQQQVFNYIGEKKRPILRRWRTEAREPASQSSRERHAHDWHEGARLGEADHPGPGPRPRCPLQLEGVHQTHHGNHAPMMRYEVSQTLGEQRGACPLSTTSAGEFAKWESPRPQPPLRPNRESSRGQRSGEFDFYAAMRPFRSSRPGSAQGNPSFFGNENDARWDEGLHSKIQRLEDAISSLSQELGRLGEQLKRATFPIGEPTGDTRSAALSRQGNNMMDSAALSRQGNNVIDLTADSYQPVFCEQSHFRGESQPPNKQTRRGRQTDRQTGQSESVPPMVVPLQNLGHHNMWKALDADAVRRQAKRQRWRERRKERKAAAAAKAQQEVCSRPVGAGITGLTVGGTAPVGGRERRAGPSDASVPAHLGPSFASAACMDFASAADFATTSSVPLPLSSKRQTYAVSASQGAFPEGFLLTMHGEVSGTPMPHPKHPSWVSKGRLPNGRPPPSQDLRALPIPEPYDKHDPQPPRHVRNEGTWSWDSYRTWMQKMWGTNWKKKSLRKVLQLRAADGSSGSLDWKDVPTLWSTPGWIYVLFHFPSGRLYVGQTKRLIWHRAREHWWSRGRTTDLLHEAHANDCNPFSFIMLPLEKLPAPDTFPRAERDALIRRDALDRERKWVGKLNSMWPLGFNAAYPGVPVSRKVRRKGHHLPTMDPTPSRQGDPPRDANMTAWLERCRKGDSSALAEAKGWVKPQLCAALDWLQDHVPEDDRRIGHLSLENKLIEIIKSKRQHAPERHFLKFCYSNNGARFLELRKVLREVSVYKLHPNPEVAAALMVCDKFAPQWQAWICNYAKAAEELNLEEARTASLEFCDCKKALRRDEKEAIYSGHVVSNDSSLLRWPFLQTLAQKGKKFRLEGPPDSVLHDLHGFGSICDMGMQGQPQ